MPNDQYQYMVDFSLPKILDDRFTRHIPDQRALINQYFSDGKLVSYGVSLETSKIWAVFTAESEFMVAEWVRALPLTRFTEYRVSALTFYNVATERVPSFSVN